MASLVTMCTWGSSLELNTTPFWPFLCFRLQRLHAHVRKTEHVSPQKMEKWDPFLLYTSRPISLHLGKKKTASLSSWTHSTITPENTKKGKKTTKAITQYLKRKKNKLFLKKIKKYSGLSAIFFLLYRRPASKKRKKEYWGNFTLR